ncbi:MAG: hypothetical protein KJO82_04420 [Gammaproteobacteria bacterium]|nr:hypothetical protein [Gammaproteobacteria bacterium]
MRTALKTNVSYILFFILGVTVVLAFQSMYANAAQQPEGLSGLESCLVPKHMLRERGTNEPIETEIVAIQLVGFRPDLDVVPITVLPQGAVVPGPIFPDPVIPDSQMVTPIDTVYDVYFGVSLTDLAGVTGMIACNCMGNLCRGLDCPSGAGLCRKTSQCLNP